MAVVRGLQRFFLFEHGARLLRPGAANWLVSMLIVVFAMAIVEGATLGKILTVFLPPDLWLAGLVAGVFWGLCVLIADLSFASQDVSGSYRRGPGGDADEEIGGRPRKAMWRKLLAGMAARVCIVVLSMGLSGPFLARNLEERKVVQEITLQNDAAFSRLHAGTAAAADRRIAAVEAEIRAARAAFADETAGGTGRPGHGPAARAIETNLVGLERDLAVARQDKATRLAGLAGMSPEMLARTEGLVLLRDNPDTRAKVRARMQASEERILGLPATEVLASAVFLLLFLVMLLLKLCQPSSVSIYFNDHLQDAYLHYLAGGYDDLPLDVLPASDRRMGPSPMTAQRFDAWYHERYLPNRRRIERHEADQARRAQAQAELAALRESRDLVLGRIAETDNALAAAHEQALAEETERRLVKARINALKETIMDTEADLRRAWQDRLAAQRAELEDSRSHALLRRGKLVAQLDEELPDRFEAIVQEIQRVLSRFGAVSEAAAPVRAASDPHLASLYAERDALAAQRYEAGRALEAVDQDLGRIAAGLADVDQASARALATIDADWLSEATPSSPELAARWRAMRQDLDASVEPRAFGASERHIDALGEQLAADDELHAHYQALIRRKELALSVLGAERGPAAIPATANDQRAPPQGAAPAEAAGA